MRALAWALAPSLAASLAFAQGAIVESLDDVRGAPEAPAFRGLPPGAVDISASLPPPMSQGDAETCTSWAVTYAAASAALWARNPMEPLVALSPAFTYPLAGGGQYCRGFTFISRTLDVLRDTGALPMPEYVYDPGWCGRRPTAEQQARAASFRIAAWQKLDASDLEKVKGQLADHRPVIFGMSVGPAFHSFRGGGVFDAFEEGAGTTGHAMVLVGYDNSRAAFRLMNSFGRDWGDGGYAWLGYDLWRRKVKVGFVIAPP